MLLKTKKMRVRYLCTITSLFLLLLFPLSVFAQAISNNEFNALKTLYSATKGISWKTSWDISKNDVHEGHWHGVKVENGKVVEIDLSGNNLGGSIPSNATLTYLSELRSLDLSSNSITGSIPANFSNFKKLSKLNISGNSLTAIDYVYPDILDLDMSDQEITYSQFVYNNEDIIITLPKICLYGDAANTFKIQIDGKSSNLTSNEDGCLVITKDFITSTNINATSKVSIEQLTGKAIGTKLLYNSVGIVGSKVPEAEYQFLVDFHRATQGLGWGDKKWSTSENNVHEGHWLGVKVENGHVVEINLDNNKLRGPIPESIRNLTALRTLILNSNKSLVGELPKGLGLLKELTNLGLYNCGINGQMPEGFEKLSVLDIRYNSISDVSKGLPANLINLYATSQSIEYDEFLFEGNDVDIQLPNVMLYDYTNKNFAAKNNFRFRINGKILVTQVPNDEGIITIPKELLFGLNSNNVLVLEQTNGTFNGSAITFKNVIIKLPKIQQEEYEALVAIYNTLNGVGWPAQVQWNIGANSLHESVWPGVKIEDGHVVSLDFSSAVLDGWNYYIRGVLPAEIGNFPKLRYLHMGANSSSYRYLTGALPKELGNLTELEELYLYRQQFEGEIPKELGNLKKLRILHLAINKLSGEVPKELGLLENLTGLYLYENTLSGEVPVELKNLDKVTHLQLNNNKFTGSLPSFFPKMESLKELYLNINQFSGSIPKEYGSRINHTIYQFEYNRLNDLEAGIARGLSSYLRYQALNQPLFKYVGDDVKVQLPNIMRYSYTNNDFSEQNTVQVYVAGKYTGAVKADENGSVTIPKAYLSTLRDGQEVYLYQNSGTNSGTKLSFDSVEVELKTVDEDEFNALVVLYNTLNGSGWPAQVRWDITSNNLHEGAWPGVKVEDGHIVSLDFSNSVLDGWIYYIRGALPAEIGNFPKLRYLHMGANSSSYRYLTGSLPKELGNLTELEELYLYRQQFEGEIPKELSNLKKLRILHLAINKLSGEVPKELGLLENLTGLYLYENTLSGEVPVELKKLDKLTHLQLNNNKFTGSLPSFLPEMESLKELYLNANQFSGFIPKEYGSRINHTMFQLEYNRLNDLEAGLARGLSNISLRYQALNQPLFKYVGADVKIELPNIMRYSYTNNDFSEKNSVQVYVAGKHTGTAAADENGSVTIPKAFLSTLRNGQEVYLYQTTGTSAGTKISFDSVEVELKTVDEDEFNALVVLYNTLNGPNWPVQVRWDITTNNLHEGAWPGVKVEDGHIVSLDFSSSVFDGWIYYVRGVLPAEIGNFPKLRYLHMGANSSSYRYLTGALPKELGSLTELEELYLYRQQFEGEIPKELSNLKNLRILNLSYNKLSGELPRELGGLESITGMHFYDNQLTGAVPEELTTLEKLSTIDLRYNQFSSLEAAFDPSVALYLNNLTHYMDEFKYKGDAVEIQLPNYMMYDHATSSFDEIYSFKVTFANKELLISPNEDGVLTIPVEFLLGLQSFHSVVITQQDGAASGSVIRFKSLDIALKPIPNAEYQALLAIYENLNGAGWHANMRWDVSNGNDVHKGGWHGVMVQDGHVISINLYDRTYTLKGTIPSAIGDFPMLRYLNLGNSETKYYRYITGTIPNEIGKLTNLEELYIYNQSLTGEISYWIDKLTKLRHLNLSNNYLEGELSSSIEQISNLQTLNLRVNKFTGGLPDLIGNLQYLESLQLDYNQLDGTIPQSLNDLPSIKALHLNNNMFEALEKPLPYQAHISVSVANQIIKQDRLLVGGEYVTYDLPIISRYDHTKGDFYASNNFSLYINDVKVANSLPTHNGRISFPAEYFANLEEGDKIKFFQEVGSAKGSTIEFNEFYLGVAVDQSQFSALVDLYNSTNGAGWTYQWDISKNDLHERMWYGVVVEDGKIIKIDLQNNQLSGTLPTSLNKLPSLNQLSLYNNNIGGQIPSNLGELKELKTLLLNKNSFSGNIPSSIYGLSNIEHINFSNNKLFGDILPQIEDLPKLNKFDISNNLFEGKIPNSLFNLPAIKELSVARNKYSTLDQTFDYDEMVYVHVEGQDIAMTSPLIAEGTVVKALVAKISLFDKTGKNFDAKNTFELYVNDILKGESSTIEDGYIIFSADVSSSYEEGQKVYVYQRNGSAYGTTVAYDGISDSSQLAVSDEEYQALVTLYNTLGGSSWTKTWDITENNIHTGTWHGVSFRNGGVIGIELEHNNLKGNLPDVFAALPNLIEFSIPENAVSGNIPASLMSIGTLKKVNLSDNNFKTMDTEPLFAADAEVNLARQIVEYPDFLLTDEMTIESSNLHRYDASKAHIHETRKYQFRMDAITKTYTLGETTALSLTDIQYRWNVAKGQLIELQLVDGVTATNSRNRYYVTYKGGDTNMDAALNVLDIALMVKDMQSELPQRTLFNQAAADANGDGKLNVLDAATIANIIQRNPLEETEGNTLVRGLSVQEPVGLSIEDGILYVDASTQISAFDIRIQKNDIDKVSKLLSDRDIQISISENENGVSILGFSPEGTILDGRVAIAKVGNATITNAVVANAEAKGIEWELRGRSIIEEDKMKVGKMVNYPNPFSESTTILFSLPENVRKATLRVYSLNGNIVHTQDLTDLNSGEQRLEFYRNRLSIGTYICVLSVQSEGGETWQYRNKMQVK